MKTSTRERIDGLVMAAPWLIGFFVFVLSPTVRTFIYSFQDYDIIHPPVWVGLDNYRRLFAGYQIHDVRMLRVVNHPQRKMP